MINSHSFRLASRTLAVQRLHRPTVALPNFIRQFSISGARQQIELPPEITKHIEHTELYEKLKDKPEAMVALVRLASIVEDAGIDLTSGRPPSPMQMFRLASNRKFNREIKSVMEELEASGLNVFSEDGLEEMLNMAKTSKTEASKLEPKD